MRRTLGVLLACFVSALPLPAQEDGGRVIFQEDFADGLDESWQWLREHQDAWRIRAGALEIRSEPGDANTVKNALLRAVPDRERQRYAIEVTVANTTPPTEQYEQVGLTWYHEGQPVFKLVKERIDGQTYVFPGKVPVEQDSLQLRLIVSGRQVVGQYRTDEQEEYRTAVEAKLPPPGEDAISLQTYHGPADAEHWMRFDDFRIVELAD